jgi:phosphoribosylformylglycinamidine synthase subunit PurSL
MSAFGRIPNVEKTMTADIKKPGGSALVLVGELSPGMGGSTYYDVTGGQSNNMPKIDGKKLKSTLRSVHQLIQSGEILSCHDVSEGGVAGAVAEMCVGGSNGARIWVPEEMSEKPDNFLFNETAGCFVIEIDLNKNPDQLLASVPHKIIGATSAHQRLSFEVRRGERTSRDLFSVKMQDIKDAWQQPTQELFS